jgi:hypothetical protein
MFVANFEMKNCRVFVYIIDLLPICPNLVSKSTPNPKDLIAALSITKSRLDHKNPI